MTMSSSSTLPAQQPSSEEPSSSPSSREPSSSQEPGASQDPGSPTTNNKGEKKKTAANATHRDAENRRRDKIRAQFYRLTQIVPGLEGCDRNEAKVLRTTLRSAHQMLLRRRELIAECEAMGIAVPQDLKAPLEALPEGWLDDPHEEFDEPVKEAKRR